MARSTRRASKASSLPAVYMPRKSLRHGAGSCEARSRTSTRSAACPSCRTIAACRERESWLSKTSLEPRMGARDGGTHCKRHASFCVLSAGVDAETGLPGAQM